MFQQRNGYSQSIHRVYSPGMLLLIALETCAGWCCLCLPHMLPMIGRLWAWSCLCGTPLLRCQTAILSEKIEDMHNVDIDSMSWRSV